MWHGKLANFCLQVRFLFQFQIEQKREKQKKANLSDGKSLRKPMKCFWVDVFMVLQN